MNGEIFDYDLIMKQLQNRGHRFRSHCDTEVAVHLLEDRWTGIFDEIDGQYAIAAYDQQARRLLLGRDRMGICPLFYAIRGDLLVVDRKSVGEGMRVVLCGRRIRKK